MLINYGYEITVSVVNPTPMICLLDIHPEHRADIRAETPLGTQLLVPTSTYIDMFGNQCRRLVASAGDLTLHVNGTIADSGLQDPVVPQAVERGETEILSPPSFQIVADSTGITERALAVWLRNPHPNMPDFILPQADMENVIAYIMSLKSAAR